MISKSWVLWNRYLEKNEGSYQRATAQYFRISLGSDEDLDLTRETQSVKRLVREILSTTSFDYAESVQLPLIVYQFLVEAMASSGFWFELCDSPSGGVAGGYPLTENEYLNPKDGYQSQLSERDADRYRTGILIFKNAFYLMVNSHLPSMQPASPMGSSVVAIGGLHPLLWSSAMMSLGLVPLDYFSISIQKFPFSEQAITLYIQNMRDMPLERAAEYSDVNTMRNSLESSVIAYLYRLMFKLGQEED
jgi:hypothetical protein